jgi:uncharacterized UPF0160 family protein
MSFLKKLFTKKVHVVTHNGAFHADDIFAVALLDLVHDGHIRVTRTRDENVIAQGDIVVDVGMKYDTATHRYDHHQTEGAGDRGDGIPYSGCGLIWKHFGRTIVPNFIAWSLIDTELIRQIDASDNALQLFTSAKVPEDYWDFDKILKTFNPKDRNSKQADIEFAKAVQFVKRFLRSYFAKVADQIAFWAIAEQAYTAAKDKRIIVLPEGGSWVTPIIAKKEPLFVLFPTQDKKGWAIRGVPLDKASFEVRKPLPENWRGKKDADFISVSGVATAKFCHRTGYMAITGTFEDAMLLANKALQ